MSTMYHKEKVIYKQNKDKEMKIKIRRDGYMEVVPSIAVSFPHWTVTAIKKNKKGTRIPSYLLNANRNEVMTDQKGRVLEFLFLSASSDTTPDSMVASRMSEGANVSGQVYIIPY